jgi:hypothetical protein
MKVVNTSNQSYLIKGGDKKGLFLIKSGINTVPIWVSKNSYAKRLKSENILIFEEATVSKLEILKSQADRRDIPYGEYTTEEQLEVLLNG